MRLPFLFMLVFFVYSISGNAQHLQFRLGAGVHQLNDQSYSSTEMGQGFIRQVLFIGEDTLQINYWINAAFHYRSTYRGQLGYHGYMEVQIPLNPRLYINTGIGFNYSKFNIQRDFDFENLDTITIDTTPYMPLIFIGGGSPVVCDCFENSYADVSPGVELPSVQSLSMTIPLKVHYALIPRRLSFAVGAYSQIPLWIAQKNPVIRREMEEVDGMTKCKYVIDENLDLSGIDIRRIQFGLSANVDIGLFDGLALTLGVAKQLSNTFVSPQYQIGSIDKVYRPFQFSAGLVYHFKKKESISF